MDRFLSPFLRLLLIAWLATTSSGCWLFANLDDDDDSGSMMAPAPAITYSPAKLRVLATLPVTSLTPTVTDAPVVDGFQVAPPLPAGLTFDPDTGEIAGTPTAVTAPMNHTVTAVRTIQMSRGDGVVETDLEVASTTVCIEVVPPVAPQGVAYIPNPALYSRGNTITPNVPVVDGVAHSFAVSPSLPNGLELDATSGVISGAPQDESPATDYTITATNPFGSLAITLNLRVAPQEDSSHVLVANADRTLSVLGRDGFLKLRHRTRRTYPSDPLHMAATPDGRFLYTVCVGGEIVVHDFDTPERRPDRGTILSENVPGVFEMAVDPLGQRLVMLTSGALRSFEIFADGSLGTEETLALLGIAFEMAFNPTTHYLYVLHSSISVIATFRVTPNLEKVGSDAVLPGYLSSIAVEEGGEYAYVLDFTGQILHTLELSAAVDPAVPTFSSIQATSLPGAPAELATGRGNVYVADNEGGGVRAFEIDPSDGRLTQNPSQPVIGDGTPFDQLAVAPGGELYALDAASNELWVIDQLFLRVAQIVRTRPGPTRLLAHPGPRVFERTQWVFATSPATDEVSVMELTYADGALTPTSQGPVSTGDEPSSVAIDDERRYVYVANRGDGTVSKYDLDPATGTLSNRSDLPLGGAPSKILIDDSGEWMFVGEPATARVVVLAIDASDGTLAGVGDTSDALNGLSGFGVDPTGRLLFALDPAGPISRFAVDPLSGALSFLGSTNLGGSPQDIAFDLGGRFAYVADSALGRIRQLGVVAFDGSLLTLSPASITAGAGTSRVVTHPRRDQLYALNPDGDDGARYDYDFESGLLTEGVGDSPFFAHERPVSLVLDANGTFMITGNDDPAAPALHVYTLGTGVMDFNAFDSGDGPPGLAVDAHVTN